MNETFFRLFTYYCQYTIAQKNKLVFCSLLITQYIFYVNLILFELFNKSVAAVRPGQALLTYMRERLGLRYI